MRLPTLDHPTWERADERPSRSSNLLCRAPQSALCAMEHSHQPCKLFGESTMLGGNFKKFLKTTNAHFSTLL